MTEFLKHNVEDAALRRDAEQWLARLTSGEATTADVEALHRWRRTSRQHRRAFAEANLLWEKLHPAAREAVARQQRRGAQQGWTPARLGRRAFLGGAAAAASVAGAYAAVQPPFHIWPSLAEFTADYRTGTGQQRQITLGSDIALQLNTQTSVAMLPSSDADDSSRRIALIFGEAAATAAGAASLEVVAGSGRIIAQSARVNVRKDDAAVCVACLEGRVAVGHSGSTVTIPAGKQISYTATGIAAAIEADADAVTAWQRRLLVFRDAPLASVIDEVNRYRPGKIILTNTELGQRSVLATFQLDHLDDVVPRLQTVFGLRARWLPAGIVLLS